MKRFLLRLTAGFFLFIYGASNNSAWMKEWVETRTTNAPRLPSEKALFGDLYVFSHLPQYHDRKFVAADVRPYYPRKPRPSGVDLYSICDSYLYDALRDDSLLRHADRFRYTDWMHTARTFYLRPGQQNVLLLEFVERYVREMVGDTAYLYRHLGVAPSPASEQQAEVNPTAWAERHIRTRVFNRNLEQNLEFVLFDYPWFRPFQELKASLNKEVFGRQSKDVVSSGTRRQLYYAPTVDTATSMSSFRPLPEAEARQLVRNLNAVYRHYRRLGFDEVYLAIMPNPVTVLEPTLRGERYNGLIPRIQNDPTLQMPVLDMYAQLQKLPPGTAYQTADSHWSRAGFLAGIALLDSALATHATATHATAAGTVRPVLR